MKTYKKLVRDRIPEIIKADGGKCKFHVANKFLGEYETLLFAKLREETEELINNPCAEEIADVLEVIETIAKLNGIGLNEIKEQKIMKKSLRGGFGKKIILETTDEK